MDNGFRVGNFGYKICTDSFIKDEFLFLINILKNQIQFRVFHIIKVEQTNLEYILKIIICLNIKF